jgi:hypothetical protein
MNALIINMEGARKNKEGMYTRINVEFRDSFGSVCFETDATKGSLDRRTTMYENRFAVATKLLVRQSDICLSLVHDQRYANPAHSAN